VFELAVTQPSLDMPELLWKHYIDLEIAEGKWACQKGERIRGRKGGRKEGRKERRRVNCYKAITDGYFVRVFSRIISTDLVECVTPDKF
jgi:hypothetical protein